MMSLGVGSPQDICDQLTEQACALCRMLQQQMSGKHTLISRILSRQVVFSSSKHDYICTYKCES